MKKYILVVCLMCLCGFMVPEQPEAAIIPTEEYGLILYDDVNELYWFRATFLYSGDFNSTLFLLNFLNEERQEAVEYGLPIDQSPWRIATSADMGELWSHYSADEIAAAFLTPPDINIPNYLFGIYDSVPSPGYHHAAGNYSLSSLTEYTIGDDEENAWLGQWLAADPMPVPLPGSIIFLAAGLAMMGTLSRQRRNE